MEKVNEMTGKRTKRAVSRVQLVNLGWSANALVCFENYKQALKIQVMLSHRDPSKRLCFYTDASDRVWSGIVSQVPVADFDKLHRF